MGRDEQKEEREVLDSIFPDEITDITETEFRVSILLDVSNEDDDASDPLQYTENYPDDAPRLDVSAPPNAPKHKYLDIQGDKARLLEALEPTIEENLGMQMVFTLVSVLKDSAELLIAERQKVVEAEREFEAQKAEEEENRKFHGTAVTRESFLEWRQNFRKEMEEEERRKAEEREVEDKKRKATVKEEKKLTGRELWERGLVGKVEDEDEGDDGLEAVNKLNISA